jgi:hypothetical protein
MGKSLGIDCQACKIAQQGTFGFGVLRPSTGERPDRCKKNGNVSMTE